MRLIFERKRLVTTLYKNVEIEISKEKLEFFPQLRKNFNTFDFIKN